MTRLENRLSRKELFDIGEAFIDDFIASYNFEPDAIIIDADDTNADTYGAQRKAHPSHPQTGSGQQGNQHFRPAQTIDNQAPQEVETHSDNSTGRLPFLLPRLHGQGNRATGWHPLHYGLAGNVKLQKITAHWLDTAVASYKATGEEVRMFHSFMYKANSWKHPQRVVVKIEVNSLGTNVRYVVTDFKGQRSSFIYSECYCDRGRMEQMIAELKNGLKADRMSCKKFSADQFRLYLHCAAYVILHSFQADMLVGTELECSTITTMREKLLLSAVSIDEKKTCIRLRFSQKAPMLPEMVPVLTRLQHLTSS